MQEPIDATHIWRIGYADQELMRTKRNNDEPKCGNAYLGTVTHRVRFKTRKVCKKRAKKLQRLGESVTFNAESGTYSWILVVGLQDWQRYERRIYRNNPEYQRHIGAL